MASIFEKLGHAKATNLIKYANNERIPHRGKKKHHSQMSQAEKDYLMARLTEIRSWKLSNHSLDRIREKGINATYMDVVSTIHNASIIEYHLASYKENNDHRVVLRAKAVINRHYNLNIVYSISRRKIITVWINDINDKHETIDMSCYCKTINLLKIN